jgi:hypothetical protein
VRWAGLALDHLAGAPHRRRIGAALREHVGHIANRRQRVTQFVRQHREEIILAAIGLAQRLCVFSRNLARLALGARSLLQLVHEHARKNRDEQEEHHVRDPLRRWAVVRPAGEGDGREYRCEDAG